MSDQAEEIVTVSLWRLMLPLAKLWGALGVMAFLTGVVRVIW